MELEFVKWLRGRLPPHRNLALPAGDDAAVIRLAGRDCVLTVDMLTEGVDFQLDRATPRQVGRKALAVNLSDIAAMAAQPVAALVALALPRHGALELAREFFEGLIPLAERYDVAIAGGDTNSWDGPLVASITLAGRPTSKGVLTRAGASRRRDRRQRLFRRQHPWPPFRLRAARRGSPAAGRPLRAARRDRLQRWAIARFVAPDPGEWLRRGRRIGPRSAGRSGRRVAQGGRFQAP